LAIWCPVEKLKFQLFLVPHDRNRLPLEVPKIHLGNP
jgi:hypothetical protein